MKINEIVRDVMENTTNEESKKIKQSEIIARLKDRFGLEVSAAAFSDRLKNENMTMNTALEILDVLGYEIVVQPKTGSRKSYNVERGKVGRK